MFDTMLDSYLNLFVYSPNIFGSSLEVFGKLRKSSVIFGNVRKRSYELRETSGESLDIFRKSSKTSSLVFLSNKQIINGCLEI